MTEQFAISPGGFGIMLVEFFRTGEGCKCTETARVFAGHAGQNAPDDGPGFPVFPLQNPEISFPHGEGKRVDTGIFEFIIGKFLFRFLRHSCQQKSVETPFPGVSHGIFVIRIRRIAGIKSVIIRGDRIISRRECFISGKFAFVRKFTESGDGCRNQQDRKGAKTR